MAVLDIKLKYKQVLSIVNELSTKEKKRLMYEMRIEEPEIPLEVQELSLKRLEAYRKNPESFLDWDEVSKTL